jgi:hypothetical protein
VVWSSHLAERFEVLTVVKIQVEVWVVTLCSVAVKTNMFEDLGPCCLHLQAEMNGTGREA